jgi:adenylate cyclase
MTTPAPSPGRDTVARLRHELRTPLNHILGYGELLLDEIAGTPAASFAPELEDLCAAGRRALTLVNDLLDPARPSTETVDAETVSAALTALLRHIVERTITLEAQARARDLSGVQADIARIEAAAAQMLALLTEETLRLLADPSVGPQPVPARPAGALHTSGEVPLASVPGTVLVVDDSALNRDMLARRLERLGCTVLQAENGADALALPQRNAVDLVLLDVVMPGMSGYEVLERWQADERLRQIPVLMISALDETESVVRCIALGAEDYLPKPFDPVLLRARVGAILERKRLRDQERQHLTTIEAQAAELTAWNQTLEQRVQQQVDQLERLGRLRRFLSPQLAELIVSCGDESLLESHRREVTVVFCDLRGFTAFAEAAEPEDVIGVLREFHGALGPLISEFEGTLEHFEGDGFMVFFNDPLPCPDPAWRAVQLAVAMRERTAELSQEWRRRGYELELGVGIAVGYATCGRIGFEGRFDYAAIGTVTILAQRLCSEAQAGQILISQRVQTAVEDRVSAEPVDALALKGFTRPVPAFNVLHLQTPPEPAGAAADPSGSTGAPDGLSAREVEVLRLVAAGKRDAEIADALVISPHTVHRHVNHIFAKTGAANRVEVAAYARRHGLVP